MVRNTSQRSKDYSEIASYYVPAMQTIPMIKNTVSGIMPAADVPPGGRPSAGWPQAR